MKRKVYVTGPLEGIFPQQVKNNMTNLQLICRRVLVAKDIPICPTLMTWDWRKDPRFPKEINWWIDLIFKELMKDCVIFCYIPDFAGVLTQRVEIEKELWRTLGTGKFIIADRIVDYLLNYGGIQ